MDGVVLVAADGKAVLGAEVDVELVGDARLFVDGLGLVNGGRVRELAVLLGAKEERGHAHLLKLGGDLDARGMGHGEQVDLAADGCDRGISRAPCGTPCYYP